MILLEDVRKLGALGEKVSVKPGYGRYLLRYQKAQRATAENLKLFEEKRAALEKQAAEKRQLAEKRRDALANVTLKIEVNASDDGKLFGSVGTREIAEAAVAAGVELEKSEVLLPDGPLHSIGEYTVNLQLHSDLIHPLAVVIIAAEETSE